MLRILLIGYGKMGKTIEQIALSRGHQIAGIIDANNQNDLSLYSSANCDVAIEFTEPHSAVNNIKTCFAQGIPLVCGTTGWLEHLPEIKKLNQENNAAFFYASNYSIGVNIFFKINETLAALMNRYPQYEVSMEEIHHTQKKDAPSGTAITLAEGILDNLERKNAWELASQSSDNKIAINALRLPDVPGTHTVTYKSFEDTITIQHEAHNRMGFALGAVLAAEWLPGKNGIFGMKELLGLA